MSGQSIGKLYIVKMQTLQAIAPDADADRALTKGDTVTNIPVFLAV
jgi:hypothetical protein